MYKISEFSKISKCSVQTLRYYDKLDILKPQIINKHNNYRYYTNEDLIRLDVIKKLKEIGYKLNEIPYNLNEIKDELFFEKKLKLEDELRLKKQTVENLELIITNSKYSNKKIIELLTTSSTKNKENKKMKKDYKEIKQKMINAYDLNKQGKEKESILLIEEIKNKIYELPNDTVGLQWVIGSSNLFAGILYEIIKNCKKEELTFSNIIHFKINNINNIENISEYVKTMKKNFYSYLSLYPLADLPKNTFGGFRAHFQTLLTNYAIQENL